MTAGVVGPDAPARSADQFGATDLIFASFDSPPAETGVSITASASFADSSLEANRYGFDYFSIN